MNVNNKLLVGFSLILFLGDAFGCSCTQLSREEIFNVTPYIFVGYLVSAEQTFRETDGQNPNSKSWRDLSIKHIEARFHIEEIIKGTIDNLPEVVKIFPGSCGFPVVISAPYIIFTDDNGNTTVCEGSHLIDNYEYDLEPDILELRKLIETAKQKKK